MGKRKGYYDSWLRAEPTKRGCNNKHTHKACNDPKSAPQEQFSEPSQRGSYLLRLFTFTEVDACAWLRQLLIDEALVTSFLAPAPKSEGANTAGFCAKVGTTRLRAIRIQDYLSSGPWSWCISDLAGTFVQHTKNAWACVSASPWVKTGLQISVSTHCADQI